MAVQLEQLEPATSNFGSAEESDHASAAARIPCAPDHGAHHKGRKELKGAAERHLARSCKQGALAPETKTLPTWHLLDACFPYIFLMVRSVAGQLQVDSPRSFAVKELCFWLLVEINMVQPGKISPEDLAESMTANRITSNQSA